MNILNIMLGKGKGGLEQAAIDYHEALLMEGHAVTSVVHLEAHILPALRAGGGAVQTLRGLGEWDPFAARRLRLIVKETGAQMALCHGNRAIGTALRGLRFRVPVVGVAHNYHIKKRFPHCDAAFCITRDLMEEMVHLDIDRRRLFHIPNLIRVAPVARRTAMHSPPVVGAMGRFVEKKGFDVLLLAMKSLYDQKIDVRCRIAGDGELRAELQRKIRELGLQDVVEMVGWVSDKQSFFESLDLFVLPSRHEPFGIVLIEAMAAGLPAITTDTEGPCEIIRQHHDAVMIEKDRPHQMAHAIRELIDNPDQAFEMGVHAHLKARDAYGIEVVAARLSAAIQSAATLPPHEHGTTA